MTAVVFSPYWNVPTNIALGETMPAVLRDRSYLQRMNLEVLRGDQVVDPRRVDWGRGAAGVSFRQRPGARNALGLVKFLLPNSFNVYLHDTPSTALFLRPQRAFSHGCVRLEKPEALARWVLDGLPGWTPARIAAAMRAGRESAVSLPQAIPVGITYFTVWVDADGTVEFRPDVYRHDAAQAPLLEPPAPPRPATALAAAG
jgi:murein L,D-transpeptidase YcbB/YkuD